MFEHERILDLRGRFSAELLQLWNYYQPKFIELVYEKFKKTYEDNWKVIIEEKEAAINVQNEVIRSLEKRIESLERSIGGIKP